MISTCRIRPHEALLERHACRCAGYAPFRVDDVCGGDFHTCWQCVHDTIRVRLKLHKGGFGVESMAYRKLVIRTLFAAGSCRATRHLVLAILPSGMWDNHDEVEIWVGV